MTCTEGVLHVQVSRIDVIHLRDPTAPSLRLHLSVPISMYSTPYFFTYCTLRMTLPYAILSPMCRNVYMLKATEWHMTMTPCGVVVTSDARSNHNTTAICCLCWLEMVSALVVEAKRGTFL
jgi:hypothetical protein